MHHNKAFPVRHKIPVVPSWAVIFWEASPPCPALKKSCPNTTVMNSPFPGWERGTHHMLTAERTLHWHFSCTAGEAQHWPCKQSPQKQTSLFRRANLSHSKSMSKGSEITTDFGTTVIPTEINLLWICLRSGSCFHEIQERPFRTVTCQPRNKIWAVGPTYPKPLHSPTGLQIHRTMSSLLLGVGLLRGQLILLPMELHAQYSSANLW